MVKDTRKWSVWDGIMDDTVFLKIPDGFWLLVQAMGFSRWEIPILCYLLSRIWEKSSKVEMTPEIIKAYCGCDHRAYYSALKKLKNIGLKRVRPGLFDVGPLLGSLKNTAAFSVDTNREV